MTDGVTVSLYSVTFVICVICKCEVLMFQPNNLQKTAKKRKRKCSRSCTLTGKAKNSSKTLNTKPFPNFTSRFICFTMTDTFLAITSVPVVYYTVFRM